ncbi:putative baseplate assembly protein [Cellulomonas humilata]|uniref:Putative baseplate assembly protein n=1 Tax=Cellulomonas humilata TaxID=144055 RepID=A0A7Y6DZD5_9CELL|nr:baseplate J/gp47 family protein [Cellulomonas humilata]NUU19598.1 putative baseplate assembly protein [Cellulomonas humilata]
MNGVRYECCDERRRAALVAPGAPAGISGIDYVEVRQGDPVSEPTEIDVVLVKPLPLPMAGLTGANIRLTGGLRFPPPRVSPVVTAVPGGATVRTYRVQIPGGQPTDFSTYRLAVVAGSSSAQPPAFLDPRLSVVDLSFKVDCPSDADCAPDGRELPGAQTPEPALDLMARDWGTLRRLMLDRISVLVPGFREDDPVDLTTTLVEALAYRLDQQSYSLDWVATEALFDTARTRTSVTRHARLVDYPVDEGASARLVVAFEHRPAIPARDGVLLRAGTPVLPRTEGLPTVVAAAAYPALLHQGAVVFETAADVRLWQWRSSIAIHTWADDLCCLPAGSTSVTLDSTASAGRGPLVPGDLLLLAQTAAPDTGEAADANPARRHVVRLTEVTPTTDVLAPGLLLLDVAWDAADALPFDLTVAAEVERPAGPAERVVCARAVGNLVLADHGASLPPADHLGLPPAVVAGLAPDLEPPSPEAGVPWRPRVHGGLGPLSRVAPLPSGTAVEVPASALLAVDPDRCLPELSLQDAFATWTVRRDLLASGRFSRDLVVETDAGGGPALRFGGGTGGTGGTGGLAPDVGERLTVSGRFGSGVVGNLGPDALGHVVVPDADAAVDITAVTNPLPGTGGRAREEIAAVKVRAPEAFRRQQRAVTAADYAEAARRFAGVANAMAVARWTGAWQTVVVHVDRVGGASVDRRFRDALLAHLERFRLAGFDVAVRGARPVPLDVALSVCAEPRELRSEVGRRVRAALSPFGSRGRPGFFHPDHFTFGTPVFLSAVVAAVMAVPGVQSVRPLVFQRFARVGQDELGLGVIRPADAEILELRDDPSFPERGRLTVTMGGGR